MTAAEIKDAAIMDALIRRKQSFVMYRAPREEIPRFLMNRAGELRLLYDAEELNEQSGFVIAPFKVSQHCPIVLIQPDCFELPADVLCSNDQTLGDGRVQSEANQLTLSKEKYTACFDTFMAALHNNRFDKLVLSRSLTLNKPLNYSPASAFYRASKRYIYSYVYLCYTPQTGVWLGITPEILLSGQPGKWNTVALAGTQSLQQGKLPTHWDDKNLAEQELVAAYIRKQLLSLHIHPAENGPYSARAGELAHLKSDFAFSLLGQKGLGSFLNLLHPTPAVCGVPKEDACQFIANNEGYDRRYYSGFIGQLNLAGRTELYVNLRCMNIKEENLILYAGGGLLASSELEDEWQETEKKLQTMLAIAGHC